MQGWKTYGIYDTEYIPKHSTLAITKLIIALKLGQTPTPDIIEAAAVERNEIDKCVKLVQRKTF